MSKEEVELQKPKKEKKVKAPKRGKAEKYALEVAPGKSMTAQGYMLNGGDEVKIEMLGTDENERKARLEFLLERGDLVSR